MAPVWKHANGFLARWLRHKYQRVARHKTRAWRPLGRLAQSSPTAFIERRGLSPRLDNGSRMNREVHVRLWEGVGVRFTRATRLFACLRDHGRGARRLAAVFHVLQ